MSTSRVALSARSALLVSARKVSNIHTDNKVMWKEINRLGSEGKWDSVNNTPKMFLWGTAKKDAYTVFQAFNKSEKVFEQSPYGQIFKAIFRVALLLTTIKIGNMIYCAVVPEEKRLMYQHRHHDTEIITE